MNGEFTRVDEAKNRIYIYFRGYLTEEKALRLKEEYKDAIAKVRPGFTVVTYAEEYTPGGAEVQKIVGEMTKMAEDGGVRKVARVVGETPLGGMQINRLAKVKTKYPARHFRTTEEAEAYLDSEEN